MSKNHGCGVNGLVAAAVASVLSQVAMAQQAAPAVRDQPEEVEEVVVYATRYRDRTADTAPVLSYDLQYFQKFEPNTVGDMLKRVPGVGFVGADVMEYDRMQMRGLGGGYTQVLINGKKVPGAGDDRSFWVDRIPAEMIERVEVLRSNSASRSGDAVAGAINIVLKNSYQFDGTYVRAGVNRWDDGEVNPTVGLVTSGELAGGRILFGANMQDRYRSKLKRSDRFEDDTREDLVSWEDQTEVKDGRDYSATIDYAVDIGGTGALKLGGFFVRTDRDTSEVAFEEELDDDETANVFVPGLDPYDQKNYGIGLDYAFGLAGGTTTFSVDHARFDNDQATVEGEHAYISGAENFDQEWTADDGDWDESVSAREQVRARDAETGFKLAHAQPLGVATELEFGVEYRDKKRDIRIVESEWESADPIAFADARTLDITNLPYELDGTITSDIREKRLDPYVQVSGKAGALSWEAGLRYETTRADVDYATFDDAGELDEQGSGGRDHEKLLPSAHLKWDLTGSDRIHLSLAGSMKRPNFNELVPALLDGEYGDNDYIGNPRLKPESAYGFDLGYERRLSDRGMAGFNVFYRKIKDLNELVNTGEFSEEFKDGLEGDFGIEDVGNAADLAAFLASPANVDGYTLADIEDELSYSHVYTSGNVGDGKVYGFEFDLSTPLTALNLANTGVFANYSYAKSKVRDFMGERRFNDQARSVYNVGFIQDIPAWGASFGATYRKQGEAFARLLGEEAIVRYGDELDLFVEKTFGRNVSVRLSANNVLDASKDEYFDKFDTQAQQLGRSYDEYEVESEQAGPAYQLVVRWAF